MFDLPPDLAGRARAAGPSWPPLALACPACSALVHRETEELAELAEAAADAGDPAAARAHWLDARELVPPDPNSIN